MQLVVLAAGHGRRFGGLKQLAPVGPAGQAVMDYTAADAFDAGFDAAVVVLRQEVREEVLAHIARHWPGGLEVRPVIQGSVAGTAQAVASTREAVVGAFGVVNADDLYGRSAVFLLAGELASLAGRTHSIVGYRLEDTVIGDAPVTRGVCRTSDEGDLVEIVEQTVRREDGGFVASPLPGHDGEPHRLAGQEVVSMNLWGFSPSILDDLDGALATFDPATAPHQPGKPPELLLPSVVGELVSKKAASVRVRTADGRCIGITHPDDLAFVRGYVLADRHGAPRRTVPGEAR